jgi:hypothetical protein
MRVPSLPLRWALPLVLAILLVAGLMSGCRATCPTPPPEIIYRTVEVMVPVPPPPPPDIRPPVLKSPAALASGDWHIVLGALLDDIMELHRYSEECRTAIELWERLAIQVDP